MRLKTRSSFIEKEHSVYKIQRMVMNSKEESVSVELIKRTIGKGEMFAYLLAVRELGNIDI